jgi:hypothetical protein
MCCQVRQDPGTSSLDGADAAEQEQLRLVYDESDYTNSIDINDDWHLPVILKAVPMKLQE